MNKVAPHQKVRRQRDSIHRDFIIGSGMALLGGTAWMETPRGKVKISIPKGIKSGKTIRIRGFGMPVTNKKNKFGDLIVTITVKQDQLKQEQVDLFGTLTQ